LRFVIACCALVAPLVLGVVTLQTVVSQNAFRMRELSRQAVALQQDYKELRLEVAELSSPRRIAREAKRLGLLLPEQVHTLSVEGNPGDGAADPQEPSFALESVVGGRP
jgi:cell division protein FtsL